MGACDLCQSHVVSFFRCVGIHATFNLPGQTTGTCAEVILNEVIARSATY